MDGEAGSHDDWLESLLSSRDVAACVIELLHDDARVDYRFVAVSPAFEQATGLRGAVGHTMRELRPDHEQFWFDLYARVAESGEPVSFEHGASALERRFRGDAFRIGAPGEWRVVVIFEDCARRNGPSPDMVPPEGSEARLERFGATLAHELRGPLAALSNGLHILKRFEHEREEARWALAMIDRQVGRLSSLVDDLLDVGRLGSRNVRVDREVVNLREVIVESIETCAPAIEARRQAVNVDADRRGPGGARRPAPAHAGVLESADQQRQVHRARRPHPYSHRG